MLKDYKLEVDFNPDVNLVFCKPQTVSFTIVEDHNVAYDARIKKSIWVPMHF